MPPHSPSSTKNEEGKRDPEMHQTKKGNQYFFGMKAHLGADAESGLVHHVHGAAANVTDVTQASELLDGEENAVYADAGYTGVEKQLWVWVSYAFNTGNRAQNRHMRDSGIVFSTNGGLFW